MKKRKTILIIDDNQDILEALDIVLSMKGYHVERASNQHEIDDKTQGNHPDIDLVLLDVLLSGQDGRTVAKQLKEADSTKRIPIIMMSAHPDVLKTIRATGADDFIPKPFEMDVLLKKVQQHIH